MMKFPNTPPFFFAFVLGIILFSSNAVAAQVKVAILYPDGSSAFLKIFEKIVSGIKSNSQLSTEVRQLQEDDSFEEISQWVKEKEIEAIVALGKQSYQFADKLSNQVPVVHGALVMKPNGHTGISLVADPEKFFSYITNLAPWVERIHTVYSEKNSGWLMRRAKELESKFGVKLIAHEANDVYDATAHFVSITKQIRDEKDAVWLPLDNVIPDKTILPMLLESAWKKRFAVFSNNPSHVKRGALFALFPDHQGMGRSLANLVIKQLNGNATPIVLPMRELKLAVNDRTASHLGIEYSENLKDEIDLIYPLRR